MERKDGEAAAEFKYMKLVLAVKSRILYVSTSAVLLINTLYVSVVTLSSGSRIY